MWPDNSTKWKWKETSTKIPMNALSNIVHNIQKVETTQMCMNDEETKRVLIYPNMGLLPNNKKEWITDTCYSKDGPCKHNAEWKKPRKTMSVISSYAMSNTDKATETDTRAQFCGEGSVKMQSHD